MNHRQPLFPADEPDGRVPNGDSQISPRTCADGFSVRYSPRPLPAYRFLPGRDPHPTADPSGHSVNNAPWFEIAGCDPDNWAVCAPYLYGADCFNHGFWWEAHEAWEPLWRGLDADSMQGHYVQGLIQAANALLKRRMDRPSAVVRLRREVRRHLGWVTHERYMGLDVIAWRVAIDCCLSREGSDFPRLYLYLQDENEI